MTKQNSAPKFIQGLPRQLLTEYLGSTFLMIAAIAPTIFFYQVLDSHIAVAIMANAIAVAFVLYALIELFGNISGAHFNPVVTMVMAFERKFGAAKFIFFTLVQIIGGITGLILTHLMFYNEVGGLLFISTVARNDYIYFGEIIGTFILIFAILALVKQKNSRTPQIIGFLVGGLIMATSSTMFANPMVTIARMLTNSIVGIRPFDGLMFIVMQFAGGLLAYVVYRIMFSKRNSETEEI